MTDSQTLRAIIDACSQQGCPACNIVQSTVARYIDNLFYESIVDPAARKRLRRSMGLCREHAGLTMELNLSDALGLAILYEDLVGTLLGLFPAQSVIDRKSLLHKMKPSGSCPACACSRDTDHRIISVLSDNLSNGILIDALRSSGGLCIAHFEAAIKITLDQRRLNTILEIQREKMLILHNELLEFIRKNDYRYSKEPVGDERDSYRRAVEMVSGINKPS